MTKNTVIRFLFERLKRVQKIMFTEFLNNKQRKSVFHCSRRLGKSFLLCVLAIIFATVKANSQIRYASVTQKAVRKMVQPIFKDLFKDIPKKFKGKWNSQEGAYIFPNGSMIHIAGVNNGHADDLRGTASDLFIIDEAAYVDELEYLVDSVAMPQLLTVPNSKLIMASSSPLSPAHEFVGFIEQAQASGSYYSFTIHDGGYGEDLVKEFCRESGGENSTTWRREYLNQLIVDDKLSIIPEWKDEYAREYAHDEFYHFYHKYESLDIGVRDKTAWLTGFYDFRRATLVIEDEFDLEGNNTTTRAIAELIKSKRKDKPYKAIADNNNLLLINDLGSEFEIYFQPTNKETLEAMVNTVRLFVQEGRIIVSPNCKQLLGCLKYGVFQDEKRKEFGRSKAFGHYDALAALIYLVRNLDTFTNPIPASYGLSLYTHVIPPNLEQTKTIETLKQIFKI